MIYKNLPIYIIFIGNYPMAISEEKANLYNYIDQFKRFFSTVQYEVRMEIEKSDFYISMYPDNILYWFTNRVILTDKEISYYSKTYFKQFYLESLEKIFKIMYDPKILKLNDSDKMALIRKNEKCYNENYKDYFTFLNHMDEKGEILDIIKEPLTDTMLY